MKRGVVGVVLILSCAVAGLARADAEFRQDRERLSKTFELFSNANELTQPPEGQSSFTPPQETSRQAEDLIERGLSEGRAVSDEYLDWLHPQMGTYFRDRLLRGQALYLEGLRSGSVTDQVRGIQLIGEFYDNFWKSNADQIADKAFATSAVSISFWGFVIRLLIGSALAPFLFSFMLVPLLGLVALVARYADNPAQRLPILAYPVLGITFIAQLYFWSLWAAYCASLAATRVSAEGVEHGWFYYILAFLFVTGPIGWLAAKERASAETAAEVRGISSGSSMYSAVAIVAFIVFAIWPNLSRVPFGWFLALVVPGAAA